MNNVTNPKDPQVGSLECLQSTTAKYSYWFDDLCSLMSSVHIS